MPRAREKVTISDTDSVGMGVDGVVREENVLKCLDLLQYGYKRDRCFYQRKVQDHFVKKSISQLEETGYAGVFSKRITALTWHHKYPYILAGASKFGDILYICGVQNNGDNSAEVPLKFVQKASLPGTGAGGAISAMKFDNEDCTLLYRASLDLTVSRVDLVRGDSLLFYDTKDYNRWFCSLDVNFARRAVLAGDNKGTGYQFTPDGKLLNTWRLHKSKIHHCEFSTKDSNLLVTASVDKTDAVRIWDIRNLGKQDRPRPLKFLPHSSGLHCARFSPIDGSRLLTSDQKDEIRVYQGPLWEDFITIKHHHKQFQHLTPIKADWHPVNDYIVIGKYQPPVKGESQSKKDRPARPIEFFDSYTGKLVETLHPPLDEICSLNVFNPTGEYLATGMNSKLVLWKQRLGSDSRKESLHPDPASKRPVSGTIRNILRGRRAREYSPASDDDNHETRGRDDSSRKKKRARTTTSSNSRSRTKTTSSVNKTKTTSKKKK